MEFQDVLARRRMVRNYTDEPIEPEVLARVADAATRAPSAGFSQGQAVVVVTDPDVRMAIATAASEEAYVSQGFDPWISKAPALLVLCVSEDAYRRRYAREDKGSTPKGDQHWDVPYWWVDAGASMMAVLLAAVDEGLSAGFLGVHAIADVKSLLRVPDEYSVIGIVTLGYGATDRKSGSLTLGHRPRSHVIHTDTWQPVEADF